MDSLNFRRSTKLHARLHALGVATFLIILAGCGRKKAPQPVAEQDIHNVAYFDTTPGKKASYVYSPGLKGSEIIMCRYNPSFMASTGEKITCTKGGNTIGEPHSAVTFPEINLRKPECFTLNPLRGFINGIRTDLFPLAKHLFGEKYGITVEDNPCSKKTVANYSFRLGRANIGQKNDIRALRKTYKAHVARYPDTDVILYGDSRGAATTFNFIACSKPAAVKAAVIEGCFDSMPHLVKHVCFTDKEPRTEKRINQLLRLVYRSYNPKGPFPIDLVDQFPDNVPLLMVTSLKDWVVAPQCTFELYCALIAHGLKNVHLLVLERPSHPGYMLDNAEEKRIYEQVVHAFYRHYGLPHNAAQATAGAERFALTQPSVDTIRTKYSLPACPQCTCL